MRIDNRYLIGGVATVAAGLTVHGSAYAAELAGVPQPWCYGYPLILDGLAVVARRATSSDERWRKNTARLVMVGAAIASGIAQGYALADDPARPAPLAWGMGIAPAIVVLLATILGATREPASHRAVASDDSTTDDTGRQATGDRSDTGTRHDPTGDSDTAPGPGDTAGDSAPVPEATASGDTFAAHRPPSPGEDPVAWLLAERREGRDHSGAAVGRAFGKYDRWGQRIVTAANDREQKRLTAVK